MDEALNGVERLIDELIECEGGFVNHPADRGGPTRFGITEAVARAHPRRGGGDLPPIVLASPALRRDRQARSQGRRGAVRHRRQHGPGGRHHLSAARADRPQPQRQDYPDLVPDGRAGPRTLAALDGFLQARGRRGGQTVLLRALEALQGERYLRLAERRPANEAFLYGWLANRTGGK